MVYEFELKTGREGFYNVTRNVAEAVTKSGVRGGICVVHCMHTTAGITITENADPDVVRDLLFALDKTFPDRPEFRHSEGNSAAHLKSCAIGNSVTVPIENGRMMLGIWQGIYFTEFDGPRTRRYAVKIISE